MIDGPLTEAQEGLWLARRLDPENPIQNTGHALTVTGLSGPEALIRAVTRALEECDAFAVAIEDGPHGPVLVPTGCTPSVEWVDLADDPTPARTAMARMRADMERPRDPARDPMSTAIVFGLGGERFVWYQCVQHVVIDGYGTALLIGRVLDLLATSLSDAPPRTRSFPSFSAVVDEDRAYRVSEERGRDLEYWKASLAGSAPARSLASGEPITGRFHHRARAWIPEPVRESLESRAKEAGASWPDLVVTLVGAFVQRHLGGEEVVLGVPAMNRLGSASARVPCMVMNVLPVRLEYDSEVGLDEAVRNVRHRLVETRRHGRYRSEQLRRDLGFIGEGRRLFGPLVNVLPFEWRPSVPGLEVELEILGAGPVDDITFTFRGGAGQEVALEVDANPELYSLSETEAYRDRLLAFLTRLVDRPDRLADIPTLSDPERCHWVEEVNATEHPVEDVSLAALLERSAIGFADRIAVDGPSATLTYRELHARARRLGRRLAERGFQRGDVVAVLHPRSVDLVVALVAVELAGGAYLPLDPDHPDARIRTILETAGPRMALVAHDHRERLGDLVEVVAEEHGRDDAEDPTPGAPIPTDPAYVIFTSGSTGTPKGVVVSHRAIVNRLLWMKERYGFHPGDRILQKTPATFDVSVWEFFLPLITGATLVVAPPTAHRDPGALATIVREDRITAMHFVPSMLGPFLDHPASAGLVIERVFCSGEALPAALRDRFHERIEGSLHNLYGPTEAAVDVSFWEAGPDDRTDPVPIGRPVWNTRLYVLDDAMRPVPPGVTGHLMIAGRQLADGYIGRPDLTDDRFVADPFSVSGARMYRTGDLAWWRPDGAVVFAGRTDHQVKVRGQRIELDEIGSVLAGVDGVSDAVAVATEDPAGGTEIAAYVTPDGDPDPDPALLRRTLATLLPEAMVPSTVTVLDHFPLTPNGKLDRRALPRPERLVAEVGVPPETRGEVLVSRAFAEVLRLSEPPPVGADFFAMGGHSLLAIEVLARIREETGVDFGPGVLFANPTVGRLGAQVSARAGATGSEAVDGFEPWIDLLPDAAPGARAPMYCVHPAGGLAWCYGSIARALTPPGPVFGLQSPGLDPSLPMPRSLDDLAAYYVALIAEHHPGGPVHLLGWSVGGIIAQTMAVQLAESGRAVGVVALLDAYPADRWRDEPDIEEGDALRALLLIAGQDPAEVSASELTRDGVGGRLRAGGHLLGRLSPDRLDGIIRVVDANNRMVRDHVHRRFDGTLAHFRAGLDHVDMDLDASLWAPYARSVEAHVVPAVHAHMTGPGASRRISTILAPHLRSDGTS